MNYKISVDYDDYFVSANQISTKNVSVVGDSILFTTNQEGIKYLDEKNVCYMLHENKKETKFKKFKHKSGIVLGLIIIALLIILNTFRVKEVKFSGDYPINDTILEYINDQNQNVLWFNFHKNNYDKISKELRSTFYEYEWINVYKKGTTIYVDINPTTTKDMVTESKNIGNIIAKKDGIITSFISYSGKLLVSQNDYVKKGDILILGNESVKGYVLADTYEEITIKVDKVITNLEYSGQKSKYNTFKLFNFSFNLGKKKTYKEKDIKSKKVFNIPYLFSLYKKVEYEKKEYIYEYDLNDAIAYGENVIRDNFLANQKLNEEKIVIIIVISYKENEDFYEITYLVKKNESIGEFSEK